MRRLLGSVYFMGFVGSLMALASCKGDELKDGDTVKVVDLVKGDELIVDNAGTKATLRLLGVHVFSPTATDPTVSELGKRSQVKVKALLVGRELSLRFGRPPKDSYGRYLTMATLGGQDLNQRLVDEGVAVVYTEFGFEREAAYLEAERRARVAKAGLWAHPGAADLVRSLRSLWAQERTKRDGTVPTDLLLDEDSSEPVTRPILPAGGVPEPEIP